MWHSRLLITFPDLITSFTSHWIVEFQRDGEQHTKNQEHEKKHSPDTPEVAQKMDGIVRIWHDSVDLLVAVAVVFQESHGAVCLVTRFPHRCHEFNNSFIGKVGWLCCRNLWCHFYTWIMKQLVESRVLNFLKHTQLILNFLWSKNPKLFHAYCEFWHQANDNMRRGENIANFSCCQLCSTSKALSDCPRNG